MNGFNGRILRFEAAVGVLVKGFTDILLHAFLLLIFILFTVGCGLNLW